MSHRIEPQVSRSANDTTEPGLLPVNGHPGQCLNPVCGKPIQSPKLYCDSQCRLDTWAFRRVAFLTADTKQEKTDGQQAVELLQAILKKLGDVERVLREVKQAI